MPADSPRATADDRSTSRDPFDEAGGGQGTAPGDEPGDARRARTSASDEGLWPTPAHLTPDQPAGGAPAGVAPPSNGDANGGGSGNGGADHQDGYVGTATPASDPWGPPSSDPQPAPVAGPTSPATTPVPAASAPLTSPPLSAPSPGTGTAAPSTATPGTGVGTGGPAGDGSSSSSGGVVGDLGTRLARRRDRHKAKVRRGLRVRQRLWTVDPWSVFKVSALFYMCMLLVLMTAATVLWNLGRSSGAIESVEGFVSRMAAYGECLPEAEIPAGDEGVEDEDCGEGELRVGGFKVDDGTVFKATLAAGTVLAVAGSVGNVLMIVLVNLISEVTGGVRYTIIKEPTPSPKGTSPRGSPRRRARR